MTSAKKTGSTLKLSILWVLKIHYKLEHSLSTSSYWNQRSYSLQLQLPSDFSLLYPHNYRLHTDQSVLQSFGFHITLPIAPPTTDSKQPLAAELWLLGKTAARLSLCFLFHLVNKATCAATQPCRLHGESTVLRRGYYCCTSSLERHMEKFVSGFVKTQLVGKQTET